MHLPICTSFVVAAPRLCFRSLLHCTHCLVEFFITRQAVVGCVSKQCKDKNTNVVAVDNPVTMQQSSGRVGRVGTIYTKKVLVPRCSIAVLKIQRRDVFVIYVWCRGVPVNRGLHWISGKSSWTSDVQTRKKWKLLHAARKGRLRIRI